MLLKQNFWKILFFIGIFLFFFLPPIDTDLGWHLRYGNYFWSTKKILTSNVFTTFMPEYHWPNSYTLSQIIESFIYNHLGFVGLSLLGSFIIALSYYAVYLIFNKNLWHVVIASFIVYSTSINAFSQGWRAQLFSFLGLGFLFYTLKTKHYYLLPLLFLFWSNLHGSFILGIVILLIFLAVQLIKLIKTGLQIKSFGVLFFFTLASLGTSLINPYKTGIYWEAWHHLQVPMRALIAEWVPPKINMSVIILCLLLTNIYLFLKNKRKNYWYFFLISCLLPFTYLALTAIRNVPLYFFISCLALFQSSLVKKISLSLNFISLAKALIIFGFGFGLLLQLPKTIFADTQWPVYCELRQDFPFPCQAVDFLKKNSLSGNFYNTFEWGGFLEWQLPNSLFFTDGRMPAWPTPKKESPYTTYLKVIQAQKDWQTILGPYNIDYLLIGQGTFLDIELQTNQNSYPWKEVYRDKIAVLYKKI